MNEQWLKEADSLAEDMAILSRYKGIAETRRDDSERRRLAGEVDAMRATLIAHLRQAVAEDSNSVHQVSPVPSGDLPAALSVQHSSGPWWALDRGVRNNGGYICHTNAAQRYAGQDERYALETAEREADKRLIAAAPDLLKALMELRDSAWHTVAAATGWEASLDRCAADADAAIAKATGMPLPPPPVGCAATPTQEAPPRDAHFGGGSYEASMLRNLLAVIHGDGGHYVATHGLDKAAEDAEKLVADLRVGCADAVPTNALNSPLLTGFDGSSVRAGPNHSTIEIWYDTHAQAIAAHNAILDLIDDPVEDPVSPPAPQALSDAQIDALADENNMGKTWYENDPQKHWRAFARAVLAATPVAPDHFAGASKPIALSDTDIEQEPVAYMTSDGRVAMRSTVEGAMPKAARDSFSIPLYAAPPSPAAAGGVPPGYVLVPIEPTLEMIEAGAQHTLRVSAEDADDISKDDIYTARGCAFATYGDMLRAMRLADAFAAEVSAEDDRTNHGRGPSDGADVTTARNALLAHLARALDSRNV